MNIEVRYFSKTGNTEKLANAIADEAGVKALTIDTPITEETDILFLGAAVYFAGIDSKMKTFIKGLDSNLVKKVVVFSTSAMSERAFPSIEKELKATGITVCIDNFYCRGKFAHLHKNRPNEKDIEDAKKFAAKFLDKE